MHKKQKCIFFLFFLFFYSNVTFAQMNYVANGGFDYVSICGSSYGCFITCAVPWDTLKNGGGYGFPMNKCYPRSSNVGVPYNLSGGGYQEPRTGDGYAYFVYLKLTPNSSVNWRGYVQQKMTHTLQSGKSYCVTYWASLVNYVNYAVDELGAYFDDGSIQSISWSHEAPANPQVKSPSGVFYSDTLNWMKVQGTFTANGTENYITLGNFRTTAATTYTSLDGQSSGIASYFIDDVSVIETDLPAYAGPDKYVIAGDSTFIGRSSEIGLDDDCFWYQLPNSTTAIDTVAGLWVKPVVTTTYVVKQDICGNIRWDTVVVHQSAVSIQNLSLSSKYSKLYPNPNTGEFNVLLQAGKSSQSLEVSILDITGRMVYSGNIVTSDKIAELKPNISRGAYLVKIKLEDNSFDIHRLIIE